MSLRPRTRVSAAALAVTCAFALTACQGSGEASQSTWPGGTALPSGADAGATGGPTGESPTTAAAPLTTSLDPVATRMAATKVYQALIVSRTTTSSAGTAARGAAFTGRALKAASAEAAARPASTDYKSPDTAAAKTPPLLLAITTAESEHRVALVEGQPRKDRQPELYIMETTGATTDLKITHAAQMLPDRYLQTWQPPAAGSPEVPWTTGRKGVTPQSLLTKYVAYLTYPASDAPLSAQPFISDPYIKGVQAAAAQRAEQIGENGTYTMKHYLVPGTVRVLERGDGTLLVAAHLARSETMTVANGATITAPPQVQKLRPQLKTITESISLETDVTLFFYQYPGGKSELVAGTEHLVGVTGS